MFYFYFLFVCLFVFVLYSALIWIDEYALNKNRCYLLTQQFHRVWQELKGHCIELGDSGLKVV